MISVIKFSKILTFRCINFHPYLLCDSNCTNFQILVRMSENQYPRKLVQKRYFHFSKYLYFTIRVIFLQKIRISNTNIEKLLILSAVFLLVSIQSSLISCINVQISWKERVGSSSSDPPIKFSSTSKKIKQFPIENKNTPNRIE